MEALLFLLAVATIPGAPLATPAVEATSASAVDTAWIARLEGEYGVVLEEAPGTPAARFTLDFGPDFPPVRDARLPHHDVLRDAGGRIRETLEPPVTLALHPDVPRTRHCIAAGRPSGDGGRELRCPLATRVGPALRAWLDRGREEEVDRTVPHMGDVLRLRVERGNPSEFTGTWEASFARPVDAQPTVTSGRFRALRSGG